MNLNDVAQSRFLKQEDIGAGKLMTIARVDKENTAKREDPPQYKVVVYFTEHAKPMVLNATNAQTISDIIGESENIETTWIDKKIVLVTDPNTMYSGRRVGGIRVRAPKPGATNGQGFAQPQQQQAQGQPAAEKPYNPAEDSDLPF